MTFEYHIEPIPAQAFVQLAFFCSESGACALEDVPGNQVDRLMEILNRKGADGWELVQLFFQKSGVIGVWKRQKNLG